MAWPSIRSATRSTCRFRAASVRALLPELVKVSGDGKVSNVICGRWAGPSIRSRIRPRRVKFSGTAPGDWPVPGPAKYHAKAQIPMRTMTIVDMKNA